MLNNTIVFQFLIIIFALFAISRTISSFKKGKVNTKGLIIWTGLWLTVSIVTLLPQTTNFSAKILGVSRGTDVVVYLSIILLFYIVFKIYIKLEKIESNISTIIKKITLRNK